MTWWQRIALAVGVLILAAGVVTALRPVSAVVDGEKVDCGAPLRAVERKDPDVLLIQLQQLARNSGEIARAQEVSEEDVERLAEVFRRAGRSVECDRRAGKFMERSARLTFIGLVVIAATFLVPAMRRARTS